MKDSINRPRLALAILVGAVLTGILGVQAFSSVATRNNPDIALAVLPTNGLARGDAAFAKMTAESEADGGVPEPSAEVLAEAITALKHDPLQPKAHVVLALSRGGASARRETLDVANRINRRDVALQGLVLQEALTDENYDDTIATLDRILRVHPRYSSEFFPILVQALENDQTIESFSLLLDGSSPWHATFLNFASRQNTGMLNLARLRMQMDFQTDSFSDLREGFDRRLIARLVSAGELQMATDLYRAISALENTGNSQSVLDWRSDYPPFDWRFVDEAGFRAQNTASGESVQVSIRPGKGGVFAERVVRIPQGPFAVNVEYSITPSDRARDMRLLLSCTSDPAPFLDKPFKEGIASLSIREIPADCEYAKLSLAGRAWSGRSKLEIELRSIEIKPSASSQ